MARPGSGRGQVRGLVRALGLVRDVSACHHRHAGRGVMPQAASTEISKLDERIYFDMCHETLRPPPKTDGLNAAGITIPAPRRSI